MDPKFEPQVNALALRLLQQHNDEIQALKSGSAKSNGRGWFNGCRDRAIRLGEDLRSIGINNRIIFLTSPHNLSHESGAEAVYHYVVLDMDYLVWDPLFTGRVPIPLTDYVPRAYELPSDVYLWLKNDHSTPLAGYSGDGFQLMRAPFQ